MGRATGKVIDMYINTTTEQEGKQLILYIYRNATVGADAGFTMLWYVLGAAAAAAAAAVGGGEAQNTVCGTLQNICPDRV